MEFTNIKIVERNCQNDTEILGPLKELNFMTFMNFMFSKKLSDDIQYLVQIL
jgi:hypothetical protein